MSQQVLHPLLLVAAVVVAYANSLPGGFFLDDHPHILGSEQIRALPSFGDIVASQRPVVRLSLAVNYAAGGSAVAGYHLCNVVIHVLAALVLYGLVRRVLLLQREDTPQRRAASGLALAVALLWGLHPLQTQAVTYVIQRSEAFMGLFYFLTLYCTLRGATAPPRGWGWYGSAVLCCCLGMASKEVMVTAPVMVLLFDRAFLAHTWDDVWRRRWGLHLALAASELVLWPSVHIATASAAAPGTSAGFALPLTAWDYARSQPAVILHYLRLALWPYPLCFDYDWPVAHSVSAAALPAVMLLVLVGACGWLVRHRLALLCVVASFFIVLAPTSSVLPINDLAVEHRLYLPLASVLVLVVLAGFQLLQLLARRCRWGDRARQRRAVMATAAVALVFGLLTYLRNQDYGDEIRLWTSVVALRPDNARAHEALGTALLRQGRLEDAEAELRAALRLRPSAAVAESNLGLLLYQRGQLEEAEKHARHVIELDAAYAPSYSNLGLILAAQRRFDEAGTAYRRGLELAPRSAMIHTNLGLALAQQGNMEQAAACFAEALRLDPAYGPAYQHWVEALTTQGRVTEAQALLQRARLQARDTQR
jgi:Flp pilus assembly protein TadD